MKTKITVSLLIIGLATLSFTFSTKKTNSIVNTKTSTSNIQNAPIGGLVSESKF